MAYSKYNDNSKNCHVPNSKHNRITRALALAGYVVQRGNVAARSVQRALRRSGRG
ncbi:MAG: hypothetical protein ABI947_14450 [Chloroflexota bacterium]